MNLTNPLVDVIMVTYNQEKFIEKAIKSVLDQVCEFDFRLLIGDDKSKDKTGEICRHYQRLYPTRIRLIEQNQNVGLVNNYKSLFDKSSATFIAILEGDDYWTDPKKLQKQIDILKMDESVGLVHTDFDVLEQDGSIRRPNLGSNEKKLKGSLFTSVMTDAVTFCPLTVVFRSQLLKLVDYSFCIENKVWTIDAFLWPEFSKHTKIGYLNERTGVYRRNINAATASTDLKTLIHQYETGLLMKLYYVKKYPVSDYDEKFFIIRYNQNLIRQLLNRGHASMAGNFAMRFGYENVGDFLLYLAARNSFFQSLFFLKAQWIQFLSSVKQSILKKHTK